MNDVYRSVEPFVSMTDYELAQFYEHGACPDCGGEQFVRGPRGGASVNTACTSCGTEWNVCDDFPFGQRTTLRGAPDVGRLRVVFGFTQEMLSAVLHRSDALNRDGT